MAVTRVIMILLLLAGASAADTVYLRDGRQMVGKVTKEAKRYKVEMTYGTVYVDELDVIYVAEGTGTTLPATAPAAVEEPAKPVAVSVAPSVRWNLADIVVPDPAAFMLGRELEALGTEATEAARLQLPQWKINTHEGQRKVWEDWLPRDEQRRRRSEFDKHVKNAVELARQAKSATWSRKPEDIAKGKRQEEQGQLAFYDAARAWPDFTFQLFIQGVLDLRAGKDKAAEQRFRTCIEREPLVAAYHQGRGLALSKVKRPLEALAEFVTCLELRDDSYEPIRLVETAMKDVPGTQVRDPIYMKAQDLLARYEPPKSATPSYSAFNPATPWLMPGKPWMWAADNLSPAPPYDRVVARQCLAVPLTEDGVLVVDEAAIAGAEVMYLQVAPDLLLRAEPAAPSYSYWSPSTQKTKPVPLSAIRVEGCTFTPVDMEKPAKIAAECDVTVRAANLYRAMGTETRVGVCRAKPAGAEVQILPGLLPGETVGVATKDGQFAGFLSARTRLDSDDWGKSQFMDPLDVAAYAARTKKSPRSKSMSSWNSPTLKADAPKFTAKGDVFLLHVLIGEKPPPAVGQPK